MVFMKSMKPQLEAKGHRFPRGFLDVISVCSPLWNVRFSKISLLCHIFIHNVHRNFQVRRRQSITKKPKMVTV